MERKESGQGERDRNMEGVGTEMGATETEEGAVVGRVGLRQGRDSPRCHPSPSVLVNLPQAEASCRHTRPKSWPRPGIQALVACSLPLAEG